jgi:hypothetical protein
MPQVNHLDEAPVFEDAIINPYRAVHQLCGFAAFFGWVFPCEEIGSTNSMWSSNPSPKRSAATPSSSAMCSIISFRSSSALCLKIAPTAFALLPAMRSVPPWRRANLHRSPQALRRLPLRRRPLVFSWPVPSACSWFHTILAFRRWQYVGLWRLPLSVTN